MPSSRSQHPIARRGPTALSMRCSPSICGISLPTGRRRSRTSTGLPKPGCLFVSKTACLAEMNPLIRLAVPVMQLVGKAPYVAIFSATALEREIEAAGFAIVERARHGSGAQRCPHLHRCAEKRPASLRRRCAALRRKRKPPYRAFVASGHGASRTRNVM